jgi:hypothetical protein
VCGLTFSFTITFPYILSFLSYLYFSFFYILMTCWPLLVLVGLISSLPQIVWD